MAIFFTSDLHFGHNKEFLYKFRGFESIEEHDAGIVKNWNEIVSIDDEVYILGDLMLGNQDKGIEYLKQLNGRKYFIIGNHDSNKKIQKYMEAGLMRLGYATMFKYNHYNFYLSHYPTLVANADDEGLKHCVLNLYGHTHQREKFFNDNFQMFHVGLDSNNNRPVEIEDIIKEIKEKKYVS